MTPSIRTIVVPTDFSEHAELALDHALTFAKTFGARIVLLHAYSVPIYVGAQEAVPLPPSFFDDLRKSAEARTAKLRDKVEAAGISTTTHVVHEVPVAAITATAERENADLIIMGTRGLTGVKHVLLGSVAERTVRLAPCPVMTVRAH
jgi:nucleotide-binding universal stress UspA family protein